MKFEDLIEELRNHWPEEIAWKSEGELVSIEELASEKMIGLKYELIYRNLSYSLMLFLYKNKPPYSINIEEIEWHDVKDIFESRLSKWRSIDDGITADIEARELYYRMN